MPTAWLPCPGKRNARIAIPCCCAAARAALGRRERNIAKPRGRSSMSRISGARQLGFWMCLALVVGNMIGSGIFLLPANLAPYGLNAIFGWVITIGGALCLATVFAALAKAMPEATGPYDYVGEVAGRASRLLRHVELLDFDLGDQRRHFHRRRQLPEFARAGSLRVAGRVGARRGRLRGVFHRSSPAPVRGRRAACRSSPASSRSCR